MNAFSYRSRFKAQGHLNVIIIFLSIIFTVSCARHKAPAPRYHPGVEAESLIREECMRLKKTQCNQEGDNYFDCSGLVREVYKNLFNIELPRTAKEQVLEGSEVDRADLRAGDLVFFKPPDYTCHVGILLGKDRFVHVSKLKGIIVSQIDEYYWDKYYWTGRRILGEAKK
ncbi:hypothetical protein PITCH_A780032 [uncultured Desulfobacterium sp.]|uniref:NlpC/P60 domain-containing protein n=1 Tax=uncultured Desulfobacterium sp. TaxID=201089 RepID=A0A445N2G8_9BACT|nr:hypothetical protein PITCH_A780032 [uncultured Desulfobacterium sp.]